MNIYNNIFASFYNFYARFKNESPRFTSILLIALIQFLHLMLFMSVAKKAYDLDTRFMLRYKYVIILILPALFFLLSRYYSSARVKGILADFRSKHAAVRGIWEFVSVCALVLQVVAIALLLSKT